MRESGIPTALVASTYDMRLIKPFQNDTVYIGFTGTISALGSRFGSTNTGPAGQLTALTGIVRTDSNGGIVELLAWSYEYRTLQKTPFREPAACRRSWRCVCGCACVRPLPGAGWR